MKSVPVALLQVEIGGRHWPVASFEDASRVFCAAVATAGRGASETPTPLLRDTSGRLIGYLSYNGRVWEGAPHEWSATTRLLYDSRAPGAALDQASPRRITQ